METPHSELKEFLIGLSIPQGYNGSLPCMGDPARSDVLTGSSNCRNKLGDGDEVILFLSKDDFENESEWHVSYRFCLNCATEIDLKQRFTTHCFQSVIESRLEQRGAFVNGDYYPDALTIIDINVLNRSQEGEGKEPTAHW